MTAPVNQPTEPATVNQPSMPVLINYILYLLVFCIMSADSWVWHHFQKPTAKGTKATCLVPKADGKPCGTLIGCSAGTSSMTYHLENVHKMEKGCPSKKQRTLKWGSAVGPSPVFPLNDKELLCLTWASNGLSYDLVEDTLFRRCFASSIPRGMDRQSLSVEMKRLADRYPYPPV